jgi:hypothetical protein
MTKRTVTAVLWLLTVWTAAGIVTTYSDVPSLVGPVLGLIVGALVWADPAGWLWGPRTDRARIARRLADLPRASESQGDVELRHEVDTARS